MAIKRPQQTHRKAYFNKLLRACLPEDNTNTTGKKTVCTKERITIHDSDPVFTKRLLRLIKDYSVIWSDQGFATLPEEDWMRIPLKEPEMTPTKATVYPLGARDRELVDQTFDELHRKGRLEWTTQGTPWSYPDCAGFFYQWRVHPSDRHKLTVISHRGQESFNVAVMGYKNSPAYVQRQIDRLLRPCRAFARAYIDDIVIFSKTQDEHINHLKQVFRTLRSCNISIKPSETFLAYPSVRLLGQKVNSLGLATDEDKLRAISRLKSPITLRQLEHYLGLTGYLREYVKNYAMVSEPLQDRKTLMLKNSPAIGGPARRSYSSKIALQNPTEAETQCFQRLQKRLSSPGYLVHFNLARQLYMDVDSSKEEGIGAMVYHCKEPTDGYPARAMVQPTLFLSRRLTDPETRYWPTELELAGLVWVLRKTRHMIDSALQPPIIYTDHGAAIGISRQESLSTTSTDKLNLRLIRASEYIQRFNLIIRHKAGKKHIVPDALSRLKAEPDSDPDLSQEGELDALLTEGSALNLSSIVEISDEFRSRIMEGYQKESVWVKVRDIIAKNDGTRISLSQCVSSSSEMSQCM